MVNRKELLESTRQQLQAIDKVVLEASNLSLAVRVERLMDSAAAGYEETNCRYDECPCGDDDENEFDTEPTDLFDVIFHHGSAADVDAVRFQAKITPHARIRVHYASAYPERPDTGTIPIVDIVAIVKGELTDDDVDEIFAVCYGT